MIGSIYNHPRCVCPTDGAAAAGDPSDCVPTDGLWSNLFCMLPAVCEAFPQLSIPMRTLWVQMEEEQLRNNVHKNQVLVCEEMSYR